MRESHRRAAERDGHRLRLPLGFRAIAAVDGEARQTIVFGKGGQGLALLQPFGFVIADQQVDALVDQSHLDIHVMLAARGAFEKLPQGREQSEQFRRHDLALLEIDDAVAAGAAEAELELVAETGGAQAGANPAFWPGYLGRVEDFRCKPLPFQRVGNPLGEETTVAFGIEMLQAAAATGAEMLARRLDMVRAADQAAIVVQPVKRRRKGDVASIGGDAVALGGDAQDQVGIGSRGHRHSCKLAGIWSISISGVNPGPASRAARLCSHWPSRAAL